MSLSKLVIIWIMSRNDSHCILTLNFPIVSMRDVVIGMTCPDVDVHVLSPQIENLLVINSIVSV